MTHFEDLSDLASRSIAFIAGGANSIPEIGTSCEGQLDRAAIETDDLTIKRNEICLSMSFKSRPVTTSPWRDISRHAVKSCV